MNTRSLTGWLLIIGPVLTFVVIGLLYPAMVGEQATPVDSVKEMMAAPELARVLLGIGSVVFVAIFVGLALLSRSMQGEDKPGSSLAAVATVILVGLSAIAIAATGLSAGALEASKTSEALAVNIEAVSSAMFTGLWYFWGIASLLIGVVVLMQKNLHIILAWIYVIFGIFVIVTSLVSFDLPDAVGMATWVGITVATAAAGVQTLKQAS